MKRKLLATLLALCLIVGMIPVAASADSMTDCPGGDTCTHAAAIGNTHYDTLQEAVEAVQDKGTITLLQDTKGSGIGTFKDGTSSGKIPVKNFTIDFATHTYTCIGPAVGSAGTQSQAFHLEWNGNAENNVKVTLKNGTITSTANSGVVMLVQNYCDLTLDHMTLDGSNLPAAQYTSSNNCGNVVIRDTTIIAPTYGVAFDVYDFSSYPGVSVTVEGDSNIQGKVEVVDGNGGENNTSLSVKGGVFTTNVVGTDYAGSTAPLSAYLAENVTLVENDDGTYIVAPLSASNAVAQVGEKYFNSLEEAISAAENNSTVILLKNYDSVATGTITVPEGKSIVLDLNGYTVKFSQDFSPILVNGQITIQDTITGGTICSNKAIEVDKGTLTLKSGTIEVSDDYGIYVSNDGHAAVNGGAISSLYAPFTGNNLTGDMNFTVTDGTLTAKYGPAIYMPGQGKLDISGGTLNGGISLRMGQVNISGGTINATTGSIDSPTEYYHYSGNAWLPDALYVFNGTYTSESELYGNSLKLNITGGTFNCANDQGSAVAIYDLGKVEQSSTVTISGDARFSTNATDRSAYQVLSLEDIGVDSPESGYGTEGLVGNVSTFITSGYFTTDPSEYLVEGKVAVESDEPGYNYMVTDANTEAPAEVVTAEPDANVSDSITGEEDKKAAEAIQSALDANVVSGDGLTAAANTVAKNNTVTTNPEVLKQLNKVLPNGSEEATADNTTIVIQPYMDISIDAVDMAAKTVTLDITPMYRTVATTAKLESGQIILDSKDSGTVNAVQIGDPRPLEINKPVTITLTLPANFATSNETLYIQHIKDGGRTYYYTGTVDTGTVDSKNLTFTNPNGFSTFTVSTTNGAVAEVEGIGYANFQDAVDAVENGGTIEVLKSGDYSVSGNKTFSITYGAGIAVTLKAATGYVLTQEGNNTYTIAYAGGGTPSEPEEPTWPFTDVTEGDDWFYDAVAYVYENGIMAGTDETTFEPTMELDRAMAAQLFYNLEGKPAVTGDSTFTDVTSGHWAVDAITWAAQNDIVAGIGGGLYDPDSNVTREQFAVMLYKYARFKGYDLTATGDLTQFPDAGSISSWAETALSWANGKGLINGHENGTIDPKGSTIRAQAASIMANFDQNVAK